MALTPVQVNFVNQAVRPTIEQLILFRSRLDAFILDFDNQQVPLPTNATVLDDNDTGTAPRADAPQLTGAQVSALRTFCFNMKGQLSDANLATLVSVSVRSVETILRGS
jgi:hypothetical protein